MFGFRVRHGNRDGTAVSEALIADEGMVVAVLWDDHIFSSMYVDSLQAIPVGEAEGKSEVLSIVPPGEMH